MSERYQSLKFDQFFDGQQCNILEPTRKSFKASESLVIQKNKVKLGLKVKNDVPYDSLLKGWENKKLSFIYSTSVYILSLLDATSSQIKKCIGTTGAITTVVTLPDSSGDYGPYCFIKFRGLAIVSYRNNANSAYLCKYSSDGMTMVNWSNTNLIGKIGQHYIMDYKIIHDRLYILTENCRLLYSDDGITFESLVTLDSSYSYRNLEYLNGYFYLVNYTQKSSRGLVRISLSGEIQDEIVSFSSICSFYIKIFCGKLYVFADASFLYRLEGSTLIPIFNFDGFSFLPDNDSVKELLLCNYNSGDIISMSPDEKFTSPYKNFGVPMALHTYDRNKVFILYFYGGDDTAQFAIYNENKFISSGNVETRIRKFKGGQGVPKQLILNNKALTANAWLKVYVKFDHASSWGSALIHSTDLNAVRKVYDFPPGNTYSFVQIKIEYGTNNENETPEDATVELAYLPVGLLNSQ